MSTRVDTVICVGFAICTVAVICINVGMASDIGTVMGISIAIVFGKGVCISICGVGICIGGGICF